MIEGIEGSVESFPATPMTLSRVRVQIVSSLAQSHKDTFTAADFDGIKLTDDVAEHRAAVIRAAATDLVQVGMLTCVGEDFWVLNGPLGGDGQHVHLPFGLCCEIANTINTYLEANGLAADNPAADPLAINTGHIEELLTILDEVLTADPDDPALQGLPPAPDDPSRN